jgi:gas vesicle protein
MDKRNQELGSKVRTTKGFLAGVLVGGLAGAGAMLLLAPQSGKRTRAKIQQKSIELREQASDSLDDAVAQVRVKARQVKSGMSDKAEELQQRGQEMIEEQKERFSTLVERGKDAVHSSRA